jgi:predicted O-methyltransferase YrrM
MIDIKLAIEKANEQRSKIDKNTMRQLMGLSSPKVRHLLNNLASQSKNYLEIGTYLGGTLRGALTGNDHLYAVAIDNFSMMPNKRQMFFDNTAMLKFQFIEMDSFQVPLTLFAEPIELYFFDGDHSFESQYKALEYYLPVLAKEFVYVCDDWNMKRIPNATFSAAKNLNLEVVENYDLMCEQKGEWWNGIGIIKFVKK